MVAQVDIYNLALQDIGADVVLDGEDSSNSRYCELYYAPLRDAELRLHAWNFAIKRAQLAADSDAPLFFYESAYTLPSDCLRLLPPDTALNFNEIDIQIEGRKILTFGTGALDIRYISRVEDTAQYDPLFVQALVSKLASKLNEKITQSTNKGAQCRDDYIRVMKEAKKINAFENSALQAPEDTWVTCRV